MKILGLINARGGSKGIKKKNIQDLDGKPLIYYAIRAGKESKYVDRIIVSTDSKEIALVAESYGAEVPFMRPDELAGDNVTQYPPTKHAVLEMKKLGWNPDVVVFLEADVPFKRGVDVDKAVEILLNSDADSVRSVCESPIPPQWMFEIDSEGFVQPFVKGIDLEDPNICMRQNLPKVYHMTSVVDVTWAKTILEKNSLFGNKIKAVVFDRDKSIDIDTPLDLMIARKIIEDAKD